MSSNIGLPGSGTSRAGTAAESRPSRAAERRSRNGVPAFDAVLERTLRNSREVRQTDAARATHDTRDRQADRGRANDAGPTERASREPQAVRTTENDRRNDVANDRGAARDAAGRAGAGESHDAGAQTGSADAERDVARETERMLLATSRAAGDLSRPTPGAGTAAPQPAASRLGAADVAGADTAGADAATAPVDHAGRLAAAVAPPPVTPAAQPTPPQPEDAVEVTEAAAATAAGAVDGEAAAVGATAAHTTTRAIARRRAERGGVERSTDELVPELRDRLERVMARMQAEYGVQVQVVETLRSQARQDALHAQGRTAPGPVVTWTRHSRHSEGRAVDVMLNGGYDDTAAFATLQRVAREEGLHTLGARDPGHMELPGSAGRAPAVAGGGNGKTVDFVALSDLVAEAGASIGDLRVTDAESVATPANPAAARAASPTHTQAPGAIARVAAVAPLARVATVATVARVAAPGAVGNAAGTKRARPASAGGARVAASVDEGRGAERTAAAADRPVVASTTHDAERTSSANVVAGAAARGPQTAAMARRDSDRDEQAGSAPVTETAGRAELLGAEPAPLPARAPMHDGRTAAVGGTSAADALARLDHIAELRDGAAARPLTHLTLTLDGVAGQEDRIRVNMRGSQLGAVLELSDAGLRSQVATHIGELQQALDQRGLDTQALQVRRATMAGPESLDLARVAGATLERESARTGGNTNFGQSSTPQRGRDERSSTDGSPRDPSFRQRSRREPKGDR